ncbi:MAG: M24 family metallopeptidase [Patescibacteria group bacterium]|jgi:Xaa-Pro aminopeptidase
MTLSQQRAIAKALPVIRRVYARIKKEIHPGISEREIAERIRQLLERDGFARLSFPIIVAAGPHAYDLHHTPCSRKVRRGDMIVIDFGVRSDGWCTDTTRTFFVGKPSAYYARRYHLVYSACQKALHVVRTGALCSHVDAAARTLLTVNGYGLAFRHTTGHGVGTRIHQKPRIGPNSRELLQKGSVVTIEPGIYVRGWGGIRIEDMIRVDATAGTVLTARIPKDLRAMTI